MRADTLSISYRARNNNSLLQVDILEVTKHAETN
jgi:hypothetical protein